MYRSFKAFAAKVELSEPTVLVVFKNTISFDMATAGNPHATFTFLPPYATHRCIVLVDPRAEERYIADVPCDSNWGMTYRRLRRASELIGASTVAIDNKIEQAMDLVKSHLMFAVREEVEQLKVKIQELSDRNARLEYENMVLRESAPQETLTKLQHSTPLLPS